MEFRPRVAKYAAAVHVGISSNIGAISQSPAGTKAQCQPINLVSNTKTARSNASLSNDNEPGIKIGANTIWMRSAIAAIRIAKRIFSLVNVFIIVLSVFVVLFDACPKFDSSPSDEKFHEAVGLSRLP